MKYKLSAVLVTLGFIAAGLLAIQASALEIITVEDITQKKEMLDLRIKNVEKQETKIREKTSELQAEVMKEMSEKS